MDRPVQFKNISQSIRKTESLRPNKTTSPAPSSTSLKSDHSMDRPIQYTDRTLRIGLTPVEATSPAPSWTSLQSDHSMDRPIHFTDRTLSFIKDESTLSATLLTEDHYRCSVCTEVFKNPVSIPCGHSYCKHCIEIYWSKPTQAECYACPQCRKRFRDRPVLNVNVALAKLIDELQQAGFSPALPAHCYAGPEDVSCDICTEMKLKAVKSCLTCCVSYCETHVRQHYTVPALQRHNLTEVTISTQDSTDMKEFKDLQGFKTELLGKMNRVIKEQQEEIRDLRTKLYEQSMDVEAEYSYLAKYFHSGLSSTGLPKDVTEVVALGRHLDLGILYDCRNDSFSSDAFLWVKPTVASNTVSWPHLKTHTEVLEDDSHQQRCKAFEMSPMLRVSAQCGLIKLSGAAAFLNHPVQSEHQDRVTLHYKTTTRLDMISPTLLHEGVSPSLINTTTATHVIIAVSYGAQFLFVFDNERISKEKNTEMENIIKKITSTFSVQDILSSLTDTEKSSSILYDCKLYADVGDWKSSMSFDEAVEIYASLPDLLGSKGERAVPLKVWLYPLKKLENTSACSALSEVLLNKAENILENLRKQIRMCEDMMTDYDNLSVMTWFPALKEKFKIFSKLLLGYQTEFQRKIAEIIQTLNVSEEGQKSIQELISISDQSPFNPDNTQQWLETKDIQLVVLNMCRAANISIVKSQKELQHFIQNPQKSRVFCFTISPIDAEDSFLAAMKQHITLMKMCTLTGADYINPLQALKSVCISQKVVFDLQMFIAAKETNEEEEETKFIAASVPGDFNGHTVQFYYNGEIVSRNIKLDSNPDPATIMHVEDTSVDIKLKHPLSEIPERYVVEYRVLADGINRNKWEHCVIVIDASVLKEIYTVSHLKPNTQYQLRYMIIFKDYMSYVSGISTFKTCRLAPVPGQPFVNKLNSNTIRLTWLKAEADEDCPVLQYMVEYREAGLEGWSSVLTQGPQCECTLTVPHSTCYRVRVSAVYKNITSKPSEETYVPVDGEIHVK
ncbi:cytolytic toxin-alpha isoform X2 [Misgurnus anguillicaudatus]|uniref:cytolytic toxin-alpha isoform X2 n=1 Tax=Misgurnus anguillicaudatus TaxID=75329 RepID=UPI003CCF1473